ncbi:hypothetical protein DOY81_007269 [Sarcophaga bullata]|nr:hypothetical protein DOY81_007269 [Sarcophaga bullata]
MALSFIKSKPYEVASFIRHGYIELENCTLHAISEFPDWFTAKPPRYDFVCLCAVITAYSFLAIAIVCDNYCVPSVERLCFKFGMSYDVAGATLLALATSAPELFISLYATFLTEGDMGIGTIVGSSVCNTLAVPAFCCLVTGVRFYIDWWPISRDLLWYKFAIFGLTYFLWDGMIKWWEALILLCFYFVNVANLLLDARLQKCCRNRNKPSKCKCFVPLGEVMDFAEMEDPDKNEEPYNFCHWPKNSCYEKLVWVLSYPWELLFFFTIPSLRRRCTKNWVISCFFMSLCWISLLTYLCSWTMTAVGFYLSVPDSVMGLIVLAFGTSVPEIISSVIVTKKGYGSMAICNAMGSNTVNVFLCLGGPWLVKAFFFPTLPNTHSVSILSPGLAYITACLLLSSLVLYILFLITRFQFNRLLGAMCLTMYLLFAVMAVAVEMKYFESRLPHCTHIYE